MPSKTAQPVFPAPNLSFLSRRSIVDTSGVRKLRRRDLSIGQRNKIRNSVKAKRAGFFEAPTMQESVRDTRSFIACSQLKS